MAPHARRSGRLIPTAPPNPTERGRFSIPLDGFVISGLSDLTVITMLGGLLMTFAMAVNGPRIAESATRALSTPHWGHPQAWAALMFTIGLTALQYLPAIVSAQLAHRVAGRLAVIPGLLGGMVAISVQGGVLGGLVVGLLAGAITATLQRISWLRRRTTTGSPVLVPLLATVVTAFGTLVLGGQLLGASTAYLHYYLGTIEFRHPLLLGAVLGLMATSDLGGAISKTAFAFGAVELTGLDPSKYSSLNMTIMAAVVAAGMVPPLGLALATAVRPSLFTRNERTFGKVAWLFGLASIPEGAVPFALTDPVKVIPASMAGGAITGTLIMSLGATISYPLGGVFAGTSIGQPLLFGVAVTLGVVMTAALTVALKSLLRATSPATSTQGPGPKQTAVLAAG